MTVLVKMHVLSTLKSLSACQKQTRLVIKISRHRFQRKVSRRYDDVDRVLPLKSDWKRTCLVNHCTVGIRAIYFNWFYFNEYTLVIYNPYAFRKYMLYRLLRQTSDCKPAPTNDSHLGHTDTLMKRVLIEFQKKV